MTTLFDVSLALAKIIGNVRSSVTTATGSATTVVDSTRTEADDLWNDGTIWITSGTDNGKSRKITDWTLSTTTFTAPTMTSAPGSGASYAAIIGTWPRDKLWEFINQALQDFGDVPAKSVSLTTVENQEAYTLPAGVYNVIKVEKAGSKTSPYDYVPQVGVWYEEGGTLYFHTANKPTASGYILRLTYASPHSVMDDDTDTISDYVHVSRLKWSAAVYAWQWRIQMSKEDEPMYASQMAYALAMSERMKMEHPISFPVHAARNSL